MSLLRPLLTDSFGAICVEPVLFCRTVVINNLLGGICFVSLFWSLGGACRLALVGVFGRLFFYAAKHGAPTSFLHTEDNPLRWKSSILLPSNLGGYCGNKGAMVTVTGWVTEVTTVAMETASQWAIFEASEKRHAPSLITVCVRKKKAQCFFAARVSCIDNESWSRLAPVFTCRRLTIKIANQENAYKEIVGNSYIYVFFKENSIWTRL